jgi:plastocyanin
MHHRIERQILILAASLAVVRAADINGTIIIEHKLTKRSVTAAAGSYQRGGAVKLGSGGIEDPLSYERAHVAIYLDGELSSASSTPHQSTATIAQQNRSFFPDMVLIPAGSTVSFPNLDVIFHNVFSLSAPKTFDLGNYSEGQTRTVGFPKPGIVFVNCRLHPNMSAVIVISPNSVATMSDRDGGFVLRGVPPGKHTVVAWHKAAGFFRQSVRVGPGGAATVQFFIPLQADGRPRPVVTQSVEGKHI